MSDIAPITLHIYLVGGQTVIQECESWEVVPDTEEEPGGLKFTPTSWSRVIGWINLQHVSLIDQTIRADLSDQMKEQYEQQMAEFQRREEEHNHGHSHGHEEDVTVLNTVWSR